MLFAHQKCTEEEWLDVAHQKCTEEEWLDDMLSDTALNFCHSQPLTCRKTILSSSDGTCRKTVVEQSPDTSPLNV